LPITYDLKFSSAEGLSPLSHSGVVATPRFGTRQGNLQITSEDPCQLPLPLISPSMFTLDILAPTMIHLLDLCWEHDLLLFSNLWSMRRRKV